MIFLADLECVIETEPMAVPGDKQAGSVSVGRNDNITESRKVIFRDSDSPNFVNENFTSHIAFGEAMFDVVTLSDNTIVFRSGLVRHLKKSGHTKKVRYR
jgi:hypothetical protein